MGGIELTAYAPSDLNGVNYWEESETGPDGVTRLIDEQLSFENDVAKLWARYEYLPSGGEPILDETRILTFHPPQTHFYIMDWDACWTARSEVVFDRTPVTEETPWGGYAGLSWRAARTLTNFRAISSEGAVDHEVEHSRARWVDFKPGFGYISPAFVMNEPFALQTGDSLNLKYRILVHDGSADAVMLQKLAP